MPSTKRPLADSSSSTPSSVPPAAKKPKHGFRLPAPDNLPDGPWRRKATKIKHELIDKAKIKKEYAKLKKAQEQQRQQSQEKDVETVQTEVIKVDLPEPVVAPSSEGQDKETGPDGVTEGDEKEADAAAPEIHPDRIRMLDANGDGEDDYDDVNGFQAEQKRREEQQRKRYEARRAGSGATGVNADKPPRERKARKPGYFEKDLAEAEKKRAEAEARQKEWERQQREREKAIKERERHRRILAKARGGPDGKRKLGKESIVLLDRVKKLVG
ncbi:hypothetical protein DL546_004605 [Coniochaeta pulveracea]|uniref:rRNA-processing protein FYV7 n=1 Tax=Coniochaeta pulveracea TaxID=177199 RepID=A0A420YD10_9PEZI|nr:hypothetical protein DL546_004605 [Coniochaeta pulveracea]